MSFTALVDFVANVDQDQTAKSIKPIFCQHWPLSKRFWTIATLKLHILAALVDGQQAIVMALCPVMCVC